MKICLIQTDPQWRRENVRTLGSVIKSTSADLYLVPELFTTGFDYLAGNWPSDAQTIPEGPLVVQIRGFLQNSPSAVICGLLEQSGTDFYNIAAVLGHGFTQRYRQKYPATTTQGRVLPILPGDGYQKIPLSSMFSVGLMVCNDHYREDEFFDEYKKRNASAVVLIADSATRAWLTTFPTLCSQYKIPAIVCNAAGPAGGGSCVIDASGKFVRLQTSQGACEYLAEVPSVGTTVL